MPSNSDAINFLIYSILPMIFIVVGALGLTQATKNDADRERMASYFWVGIGLVIFAAIYWLTDFLQ